MVAGNTIGRAAEDFLEQSLSSRRYFNLDNSRHYGLDISGGGFELLLRPDPWSPLRPLIRAAFLGAKLQMTWVRFATGPFTSYVDVAWQLHVPDVVIQLPTRKILYHEETFNGECRLPLDDHYSQGSLQLKRSNGGGWKVVFSDDVVSPPVVIFVPAGGEDD